MTRKTRRATGIYRDRYGYEVRVFWRGATDQRRYPPETPLRTMEDWQTHRRRELEDADQLGPRHSFREAARTYLHGEAFAGLVAQKDRRRDVATWVTLFGDTPSVLLTAAEATTHLQRWAAAGYAPTTINHRVDALLAVLPRLKGQVVRLPPPRPVKRYVPRARLAQVLTAMRPGLTAARCWWLFWLGVRPSQLMRITLDQVDWGARCVMVPAGKGGEPYVVPLLPAAVTQLRHLTTPETLGRAWSVSAADKTLAGYCDRLKVPRFTVYAFRRSFGQTLREHVDLDDVRNLMGHRDAATTSTYAPVIPAKLVRAIEYLRVVDETCYNEGSIPLGD